MMTSAQKFKIGLVRELGTRMTCREAECQQYLNGWVTPLDESQGEHAKLAQWIRKESKRGFVECRSEEAPDYLGAQGINIPPGITVFIFHAGQACFRPHIDREVVFAHERLGQRRVHARPQDFTEHFNEQAYQLQEAMKRG